MNLNQKTGEIGEIKMGGEETSEKEKREINSGKIMGEEERSAKTK